MSRLVTAARRLVPERREVRTMALADFVGALGWGAVAAVYAVVFVVIKPAMARVGERPGLPA